MQYPKKRLLTEKKMKIDTQLKTFKKLKALPLLLIMCCTLRIIHANDFYLVFASPYSKNPASVFGHEFLVEGNDSIPIMSYAAVDFKAETNNASNLEVGFKGIWGNFQARYQSKPLYETIEKYTLGSDRMLVFFPIKFSQQEKVMYKDVLNKNMDSVFVYKFFKANCSHAIYKLLNETVDSIPPYRYILMPQDLYYTLKKIDYLDEPFCIAKKNSKPVRVPCKIDDIRSYLRIDLGARKAESLEGVLYFRPFFHNYQDSHIFYEADNELEFFSIDVNYNREGFILDKFNIAKLRSVPPSEGLLSFSWFVGSTLKVEQTNMVQHEFGLGKTISFYNDDFAFDFFAKDRVQSIFSHDRENWLGMEFVLRSRQWRNWRWNMDFEILKNYASKKYSKQFDFWMAYDVSKNNSLLWKESWSGKDLMLELRFITYINRF